VADSAAQSSPAGIGPEPRGLAAVGVDIGGTKVAASLVECGGAVLHFEARPMGARAGVAGVLALADELVEEMTVAGATLDLELVGLGIAVPELVDRSGHLASEAVIPGLARCDLAGRWARLARGTVESDVRAAALAEARLGAGRPYGSFCYMSVGTGISYCFVQEGRPWPGSRGGAILLGSSVMAEFDNGGRPLRWVLEEIASGPALLRRYRQLGGSRATVEEALATSTTEPAAATAIDEAAMALGIGIATLVNLLDPEAIVVGGGLGSAPGSYWRGAVDSARAHTYWEMARETPILQAQLGGRSAAVGAALVGLRTSGAR
jgi:glucokinase